MVTCIRNPRARCDDIARLCTAELRQYGDDLTRETRDNSSISLTSRSMIPSYFRATVGALLAAGVVACRSASGSATAGAPTPGSSNASELAAIARANAESARHPHTEADVRFMSGMIGHHAQAIVMAEWAPTHGAGASVRVLAARIINAQQDEIATMQRWLTARGLPVPEAHVTGMRMNMGGVEHVMLMPGMLTESQMKELDAARGKEFDRLFLAYMIQHHRGAVAMVKELFGSYGAAQDEVVFKFANDVNVDQATEIARMEKMLLALTP
jgi:uncharacterized protein (DUF305 family)